MPGFAFTETMLGHYRPVANAALEKELCFNVDVEAGSLLAYLKNGTLEVTGTIHVDDLATEACVTGELYMPLFGRIIRYDLSFDADDGSPYRLRGQKDIRLRHPIESLTVLPGVLTDADGGEIATCELAFPAKELLEFLRSWRLT